MSNDGRKRFNVELESLPGREYDEDTFLYFLNVERARAERCRRPLRLLIATLDSPAGEPAPIPTSSASRLFKGLKVALRETDVTGWYRQGQVAGAVLSARHDGATSVTAGAIEQRIGERIRQGLPSKVARSLKVRIVQLRPEQLGNA